MHRAGTWGEGKQRWVCSVQNIERSQTTRDEMTEFQHNRNLLLARRRKALMLRRRREESSGEISP